MPNRRAIGTASIALIVVVPVVATIITGTGGVNLSAALVLFAAAVALSQPFDKRWLRPAVRQIAGGLLALVGIWVAAWQW